ncbi:unnamed protein product, partial [marine sediment metagenome]
CPMVVKMPLTILVKCDVTVLAMENGKAKVINPDACTGCLLCEIYCPDFALKVIKLKDAENK